MTKYKEILFNALYFTCSLLVYTLLVTILSYFNLISDSVIAILNFIVVSLLMFVGGFKLAKKTKSKGYKSGIIMGIINMIILLLLSIILRSEITNNIIVYFLILLQSSTIGGMAGINFKLKENTD